MNKLPETSLERSALERICDGLSLLSLALMVLVIWMHWNELPDRIPIHFNLSGNADGWGSKHTLIAFPGIAFFLYALLTVLSNRPQQLNYSVRITEENAANQYRMARQLLSLLKACLSIGMLLIILSTIHSALSQTNRISIWLPIAIIGSVVLLSVGHLIRSSR